MCGRVVTNYEFGGGSKNGGCAVWIKAAHMRAMGEPNGNVASPEAKRRLSCMWCIAVSIEGETYALASRAIALHTNLPHPHLLFPFSMCFLLGEGPICDPDTPRPLGERPCAATRSSRWSPTYSYMGEMLQKHHAEMARGIGSCDLLANFLT